MKRKGLLVVFINVSLCTIGQINLDSLWSIWENPDQSDTMRMDALTKFAFYGYIYKDPDSAFYYAQLVYDYAESINSKYFMAKALNIQGGAYNQLSDYTQALDYFNRSLKIKEELGNEKEIAVSLNNIGLIYKNIGDYANSIDYYFRSLSIKEKLGDNMGIAATLNNIGVVYLHQGDYTKALDYFTRGLTLNEELGNKQRIATVLNNIGMVYKDLGDHSTALEYLTRSLRIRENLEDNQGVAQSLDEIGLLYKEQSNYSGALEYFAKGLKIKEEFGDKAGMSSSHNKLGRNYFEQKEYARAIEYCVQALTLSQEVGNIIETREAANTLYQAYKNTGHFRKSLEMHELYMSTRDSILSDENKRELIRQEYKYDYEKQAVADSIRFESEIIIQETKLKESKTRFYALLAVLVLVAVIAIITLRGREKQKKINSELKNTQAQLVQSEKTASLGVLTAGIAHEINNPLNFVSAGVKSLNRDFQDIAKVIDSIGEFPPNTKALAEEYHWEELMDSFPQSIEDIKTGASRVTEIVKGLRAFVSMEDSDMKNSDLHEGIDSTLLMLRNRIGNIRIVKQYNLEIPQVRCIPGQLNQVFMNILMNAIDVLTDSQTENPSIEISTARESNQITISIKDNGPGIPDEIRDKIFDPFFTTKEVGRGKGLGLTTAFRIIEEHGGSICVVDDSNKGAKFKITIPFERA